jgi:hypothetical protein
MDFDEIGFWSMIWFHLVLDWDQSQGFVKMVIKVQVS